MCALVFLLLVDPVLLKPNLTLETHPEERDLFLERPTDIDQDDDGKVMVLDIEAKQIHVYQADGNYGASFGKAGSAPGELTFAGRRGRGIGYLSVHGDAIYVFDGAKREISVFGQKDLAFQKAIPMKKTRARTNGFWVLDANRFLVFQRVFRDEKPWEIVRILDSEENEVAVLFERVLEGFGGPRRRRDRSTPFPITAFDPRTQVTARADGKAVLVGHGEEPRLEQIAVQGKTETTVQLEIPRLDVTQADKDEFNSQQLVQSGRVKVEFPDKKAWFDRVISLGDQGVLVFTISPVYREATGFWVDADGETVGRFTYPCGENGDLIGRKGRVFAVQSDDAGDLVIHRLEIGKSDG